MPKLLSDTRGLTLDLVPLTVSFSSSEPGGEEPEVVAPLLLVITLASFLLASVNQSIEEDDV